MAEQTFGRIVGRGRKKSRFGRRRGTKMAIEGQLAEKETKEVIYSPLCL